MRRGLDALRAVAEMARANSIMVRDGSTEPCRHCPVDRRCGACPPAYGQVGCMVAELERLHPPGGLESRVAELERRAGLAAWCDHGTPIADSCWDCEGRADLRRDT